MRRGVCKGVQLLSVSQKAFSWLGIRVQKMAKRGESFSREWMEFRIQGEPHGEGLESGLRVGNGRSWSKRGDRVCMSGWEHRI